MSDEEETFESLLEGDGFLDEEDKEAQAAKERRLKRKRRLEALSRENEQADIKPSIDPNNLSSAGGNLQTVSLKSEDADEKKVKEEEIQDEFDMFSGSTSPPLSRDMFLTRKHENNKQTGNVDQQQDWDDTEGYYKATIGENITLELSKSSSVILRVAGVVGKGVFSTVLKCVLESSNSSTHLPPQVAVKCIRHNETMAQAALKEIRLLQRFSVSPVAGIIPLLLPTDTVPLEYRGHTVLVFPHVGFNLRDVLKKYGQGLGLSLTAVRSYFAQLLAALSHLQQKRVIHSDLKPDNILVSADFSTVSICDFGSAVDENERVELITPYLVSRFYRAPEIILGLMPSYAIDLWSLAVTVAELFLGKLLFKGANNNDMMFQMMQHMGPISNRLIRQHLVQTKKFPLPAHFTQEGATYVFRQETVDPVTGQAVHKDTSLQGFIPCIQSKLLKAKSAKDSRTLVLRFSDLLQKSLTLDPTRRITVKDARHHDFFKSITNNSDKK